MSDQFNADRTSLNSPALNSAPITPNDAVDLATISRAIFVGTGGNLIAYLVGDAQPTTFKNVASGQLLPFRIRRVMVASTAADLVALW